MTKVIRIEANNINKNLIKEASNCLKAGNLVAFPTETVYGLGANALDINAYKKIFIAKNRPSDNPLIVHLGTFEEISRYVKSIPSEAKTLANKFWPGPMTLLFESNGVIPRQVYGNLDKIGIRIPNHPIALALLKDSSLPICAPSANTSGRPSPTKASHVIKDLNNKVDIIIDGGDCLFGLESTVIDITNNKITILRPGAITLEMIQELFPNACQANTQKKNSDKKVLSPGMKYLHYCPKAKVILVTGNNIKYKINEYTKTNNINNFIVFCSPSSAKKIKNMNTKVLGSNVQECAHNLFDFFIEADDNHIEYIFVEEIEKIGIGRAVMNRIERAKTEIL